ncbi:MAG: D-alanyl-D-alanine carboxypeptidase/D-alanyl-D-alanine-endopeptidase [Phycisphaeraceae bacterium]
MLILLGSGSTLSAQMLQGQVQTHVQAAQLGNGTLGLLIVDLDSGDVMAQMNAEQPLIPASNMKLVTTAAALGVLGKDFTFSTELRLIESEDGTTLVIHGDGDPAFGDARILEVLGLEVEDVIRDWVAAVKEAGISEVKQIIVDDRIFDREFVHASWPTNQLHRWYCAQVGAINFNDNCIDIYARPRAQGEVASINIHPIGAPVSLDNKTVSGNRHEFWFSRRPDTNQIILRGQVRHALTEAAPVTVHDPPIFFGELMQRRLREVGVSVTEVTRAEPQAVLPAGELLAAVRTSLPTVVMRCNRDSQNLFAEALIKRIGYRVTGQPGSWTNGAAGIRSFLAERIGPDAASVVIDDGSGLSRENRISPQVLMELLSAMHDDADLGPLYIASLAEPGAEFGTLRNRFRQVALSGDVRAKSGYIRGVTALSGYVVQGERTVGFVMILNDYYDGTHRVRQMMERIVADIDAAIATPDTADLGG